MDAEKRGGAGKKDKDEGQSAPELANGFHFEQAEDAEENRPGDRENGNYYERSEKGGAQHVGPERVFLPVPGLVLQVKEQIAPREHEKRKRNR